MNSYSRFLLASLFVCLLPGCSSSVSERLHVRRVVVVNYIKPSLARVRVGFTVFGNKPAINESVPGLESRLQQAVKDAAQQRFTEVVHLNPPPTPPKHRRAWLDVSEIYGDFAKSLAAQHHADAVILILPRPFVPYGIPQYMAAEGPSLYFKSGVLLPCVGMDVLVLNGLTGRKFSLGLFAAERKVVFMAWKDHFSDYNVTEQQMLLDEAVSAFTGRLNKSIDAQGFKPAGAGKGLPPPVSSQTFQTINHAW